MLDVIDVNDSAHFNLSYFRIYRLETAENRYTYTHTLSNINQLRRQKFNAGRGW